tara:strand:+ start:1266 stop:2435 length:1170 start_codon:yes stop_codon:yes gene_type:complete
MITDEALMILHQKCNFLGNIHRGYDDRYAKSGAKIGNTLAIRLPNEFTSTTGASLSTQAVAEASVDLSLDTQRHVDFSFSSDELSLTIDDFSDRYIKPAMSVLASHIEEDVMNNVLPGIPQVIDGTGAAMTIANALAAGVKLDNNLAPKDGKRTAVVSPQAQADLVTAAQGLFQDSTLIAEQYKEGMMGRGFGFDFFSNSILPAATSGTSTSLSGYLINDAATLNGASITVDAGSVSFIVGDVITIQGVNACHPETKSDLGYLKEFAVTAAVATAASAIAITPSIVVSGAKQNVVAALVNNATIGKAAGNALTSLKPSVFFHEQAFAFGTADLVMPDGVDFSARRVMDGVSMRVIRDYTINDDSFPCRIDVIYGSTILRNSQAVRVFNN